VIGSSSLIRAPELAGKNLTWFNVPEPLRLENLRGKLVILDFWTFCCINCIQILQTLKKIEEDFSDHVIVIGVHSPKFEAEKSSAKVAAAISRYEISHPVVHDPDFQIWRSYSIRAWPTLVFISPEGRIIGREMGEPDANRLLAAIGEFLAQASGELRHDLLMFDRPSGRTGKLQFPGKLKPVPGDRESWVLADSGHHQVVILDDEAKEQARYGTGVAGFRDGTGDRALFCSPQGLVATGDVIFVADTGNHALRRIDTMSGEVTTLAGIGSRGTVLNSFFSRARTTALASPWDVVIVGHRLLFANAGTHQLGELNLRSNQVGALAGSGVEGIIDGPAKEAALAQPSGLSLSPDGSTLFFVDSETSSLRALELHEEGCVSTVIGTGLFDFGHQNGALSEATLQHPLGLTFYDGHIAIADSYNDAIRIVDLAKDVVEDLDKGDFLCSDALCVPLAEPAGIAAAGPTRLLVVDTNNHRVLNYELDKRRYWTWLE
jgi:thiol-disulfide isomerase/thioredoxin